MNARRSDRNSKSVDAAKTTSSKGKQARVACIDLFCGAGGLTHGLEREKIPVIAGIDLDPACKYPYEKNNEALFLERDIAEVSGSTLKRLYHSADVRVLAGCAPCQPFSTYAQRYSLNSDAKWGLLYEFARLVNDVVPEIVTMENVPAVSEHVVFRDFLSSLQAHGYLIWYGVVDSSKYGVPQTRKRMVLLASRFGRIEMSPPTRTKPITVRQAIGGKRAPSPIEAGESASRDKLHVASSLSATNLKRIKASVPGGSWRDWPDRLVADCHKSLSGATFPSVYGRMEWDKPAPTMTTQCYGYGNGRFGHPEQNRAISLREAAILQGFPRRYAFVEPGADVQIKVLGRLIGNAVPVGLGQAIGRSIRHHLEEYGS